MTRRVPLLLLCFAISGLAPAAPPEPRKIQVVARKFAFEPSKIEVRAGELVEVTFTSADTKHGFACKELGLEKVVFGRGEPATVRFTGEKPGSYEFKCAKFCGLGHGKMKGEIVVSP